MLIGVYKSRASRNETPRQTLTGQQEEEASNIHVTCFWEYLRAPYGPGSAEPFGKDNCPDGSQGGHDPDKSRPTKQ